MATTESNIQAIHRRRKQGTLTDDDARWLYDKVERLRDLIGRHAEHTYECGFHYVGGTCDCWLLEALGNGDD